MWSSYPAIGLMDFPKISNDNRWESVDKIVNHGSTFNTFGVAQLLKPIILRLHRRLFIFKSFGLGATLEGIATTRLLFIKSAPGGAKEW